MARFQFWICRSRCFAFLVLCLVLSGRSLCAQSVEHTWLLSIGAADAEASAARDAKRVYDLFTGTLGVPVGQARLLTAGDAQLSNVLQALAHVGAKRSVDQLVIYIAGEAETRDLSTGGQQGRVLLRTAQGGSDDLSLQRLERVLRSLPLRSVLVLLDAGVGGTGTRPLNVADDTSDAAGFAMHLFVAAGRGETPSRDSEHALATQLSRALADAAADVDRNGLVTASELGAYLVRALFDSAGRHGHPYFRMFSWGANELALPVPVRSAAPPASLHPPVTDFGFLRVDTDSAGAAVFLDGRLVGHTPLAALSVPAGEGWVVVRGAKSEPWSESVYIRPGETLTLTPSFTATEGRLLLQDLPSSARVWLDGALLAPDFSTSPIMLATGRHVLEVQVPRRPEARRVLVVRPANDLVAAYRPRGFQSDYLLRSAALPGWGAWADGRPTKALGLFGAMIGAVVLERWAYGLLGEEREAYTRARVAYGHASTEHDAVSLRAAMEAQYDATVQARNRHAAFVGSIIGAYALNLLDAYLHHARRPTIVLRVP